MFGRFSTCSGSALRNSIGDVLNVWEGDQPKMNYSIGPLEMSGYPSLTLNNVLI